MSEKDSGATPGGPGGKVTDRRDFLKTLSSAFLGIWAVGGATALASYLKAPEHNEASSERTVRVGMLADLRLGEAVVVRHGVKPFFVIRLDATKVIALSAVCTHVRCILTYDRDRRAIVCPCHDGRFDLNGNVLSGPPPKPLPSYEVLTRAGEVFVRV
jgi:cytochrome b6-f complex iron-sulfur subunit